MGTITRLEKSNFFLRLHPFHRIVLGLIGSLITFFLIRPFHLNVLLQIMYLWDAFALVELSASWAVIYMSPVTHIRMFSRKEDGSLVYIFITILLASFCSMLALFLLFISSQALNIGHVVFLSACIPTMFLSGALIHTTFAFHYAHKYYDDADDDVNKHAGGLEFPKEDKPNYLDFAYFSFVIGMTFQVSDVQITSRKIRFMALIHGIISFILNSLVVAIAINLIAGLKR